ncbi:MAG: hypothetical protein SVW57_11150, partial [Thermodesulfobacteriota bacterium]|nr:hypothetical protein [Thermodesulfobacteriota bacterium]
MKEKNMQIIKTLSIFMLSIGMSLMFSCSNKSSNSQSGNAANSSDISDEFVNDQMATELIKYDKGGKISLNNEVSLYIPAYSLSEDTEISIEKTGSIPEGDADGLSHFGQAYRFMPSGTKFDLSKPAILEINYDNARMNAQGLHPGSLQICYFDENIDRYVSVASNVDSDAGKITAYLEHFTIYLPMAKSMVPGNNAPFAVLQNPVPNPVRADAPIYIRTTALDFDIGGSVAGVKLYYRKLQPTPGVWEEAVMNQEIRPNSLNTYVYLIPADFLTSADLGAGDDFECYVAVIDNLAAASTTSTL